MKNDLCHRMKTVFIMGLMSIGLMGAEKENHVWSEVHKKIYSHKDRLKNRETDTIIFQKKEIAPFTQLVVCWNAQRPTSGHFDIFLRVHSNHWQPWIKIASWGDGIQKSYFKKQGHCTFKYVRLELDKGFYGNGFEVKVVGKDADCSKIHALFVCAANYDTFVPEKPYWASKDLCSVRVKGVSKKSQQLIDHPRVNALCSPTALSMVLQHRLHKSIDSLETARGVYDEGLDIFGSWPFNMAYAFEKSNKRYFYYVARLESFTELHAFLKSGYPIGVSVRGPLKGGKTSYKSGHFLVVVGFDAKTKQVLCYDPAFDQLSQVAIRYDIAEFLPAWERSNRIVYMVTPRL